MSHLCPWGSEVTRHEGSSLSLLSPFHTKLFLPKGGPEALQRLQAHNNQGDQQPSIEFPQQLPLLYYMYKLHDNPWAVLSRLWNPSDTASLWQFQGRTWSSYSCIGLFPASQNFQIPLLSPDSCVCPSCLCPESVKMQSMVTSPSLPQTPLTKAGNFIKISWLKMKLHWNKTPIADDLKTAYFPSCFEKSSSLELCFSSFLFLLPLFSLPL